MTSSRASVIRNPVRRVESGMGRRTKSAAALPLGQIEQSIRLLRDRRVMLDFDLAALYGVSTKVLNQAVRRNLDRFPDDFMFQLSWEETESLRSRFVTLDEPGLPRDRRGKHPKYRRYAFSEQGVAMLSSVLRSERAVRVNIEIMRAFVRLRAMLSSHEDLARKLAALEKKYDARFRAVFDAIRQLMAPPEASRRRSVSGAEGNGPGVMPAGVAEHHRAASLPVVHLRPQDFKK